MGNKTWQGLPLPRVESAGNGIEYYIDQDKDDFIRIISNRINENQADIINPNTGISIGTQMLYGNDKLDMIIKAKDHAWYLAPMNSYIRNPVIGNIHISHPTLADAELTDLPNSLDAVPLPDFPDRGKGAVGIIKPFVMPRLSYEEEKAFSGFTNVDLDLDKTPKVAPIDLDKIDNIAPKLDKYNSKFINKIGNANNELYDPNGPKEELENEDNKENSPKEEDKPYLYWALRTLGVITIAGIGYWYFFYPSKGGGTDSDKGIMEEIKDSVREFVELRLA